jgi:hypothetical protein
MAGHRKRPSLAIGALAAVLLVTFLASPAAAVPAPGPSRALWGGPTNLQTREAALGRTLDIVRIYTSWQTGPPAANTTALRSLVAGGNRTLLLSASIPWTSWSSTAKTRNSDGNPANDVPVPYCGTQPVRPGTTTPSGKTWFGAVATGDYDVAVRRWLEQLSALAAETPEIYLSFHHEADRLGDGTQTLYQQCVGTPEEYRAAWHRLRLLAQGTVGPQGPDLLRVHGGKLVFVPIFTTWGFWHTASTPTTTARVLINQKTGQPIPTQPPDDQSLLNARVTPWVPAADDYDILATDVFNYSGSQSGGGKPTAVKVDDPTTTKKEADQWRSLQVLAQPLMRWATNFGALSDGSTRPLMLAEYGSVPDPVRPTRRAAWIAEACRFLSGPEQARF